MEQMTAVLEATSTAVIIIPKPNKIEENYDALNKQKYS
jgi:hypothetical protein